MSLKRMLTVTGIVCAMLLVTLFSFTPGFAAALPDERDPPDVEVGEEPPKTSSYFCENRDVQHPVYSRLAKALFDDRYDDVMVWFCDDGMGFGQIMLALTTAKVYGGDAEGYLARREAGDGWGQIWQEEGLIGHGRPKPNGENDGVESPEDADPPEERGLSNGGGPDGNHGRHLGWGQIKDKGRP